MCPLLRKGVLLPVMGIDFSQPATFIDDRSGVPVNMRYDKNELRKRPGKSRVYEQIDNGGPIMGLAALELSTGSRHLIRASKTNLERLNTSGGSWDPITNTLFTGGDEDFFDFTTVSESNFLIITNGYDVVRKWIGSGNNTVLSGNPPIAKYTTYLSPYLLLAYTNDGGTIKPWEVQWSDTDNPQSWSGGNSGSALLSHEPSAIQKILKLNEFVAAYKKDSLWLGRKVDTSDIFLFEPIKTGIGLGSPRAVAEAEGNHFFMSFNDFYVWNGIREESIGRPVREEVFNRLDRKKINRCHALHVQELTEIWFFLVMVGHSWPNEIWKYNYRTGFWYMDTCSNLTSSVKWQRVNTESWDDDPGTWDSAQDIWDAATSVENWEEIIFGDKDGYTDLLDYTTTNDNGVAVDAYFTTKDFAGDILEFHKRWLQLDVWAKGPGKLLIDYSINEGSDWINIPYTSTQAYVDMDGVMRQYRFYFDIIGEKIRFRFRNNVISETFYIRNFYPYYLAREEVNK